MSAPEEPYYDLGSFHRSTDTPSAQAQLWFAPGMQFDLYLALDEARLPLAGLLAALDAARSIAARIVHSLGGRGVFAVELLVHGDRKSVV